MARAVAASLHPREIRLIPASDPPHKTGQVQAPAEHRVALCRLLAQELPALVVDERELHRGGVSFTIDTLREIQAETGLSAEELLFLIGSDSLAELPTWREAEQLVRIATFVTIPRDQASLAGVLDGLRSFFPAEVIERLAHFVLPVEPLPLSSTEIRERCRLGRSVAAVVTPSIERYLEEHALYQEERSVE